MGMLDGKVAIITGAGGGLGRAYALLFATEGARIVVNDLGGSRDGSGGGSTMAESVAEEIRTAGGEAVADTHNVATEGNQIVQTAIEAFGRIDILVNNAGILRDKSLLKLDESMWDSVVAVHLRGTFLCTQSTAAVMKEQGDGGVILNTSSYSGLVGNFGQSNYGAAKAGIAGFTRVCAQELSRYGIRVNCIAPMAKTRMTEEIAAVPEDVTPEMIAPVALWLCGPDTTDMNGRIFGAHGAQVFEYRMLTTQGVTLDSGDWTPALLSEHLPEIEKLPGSGSESGSGDDSVESLADEAFARMPEAFLAEKAAGFEAIIHFALGDTGTWTVTVAQGECKGEKGALGSPDCTITYESAETFLKTVTGEMDAQQAFMAGKIKADNMGVLMKFAMFFDMKRAAAAAAEKKGNPLDEAFERMPQAFLPERAAGFEAVINFQVGADDLYTVTVSDGACTTAKGGASSPDCTITYDSKETFLGTASGKTDPQQAFMAGKIKADNMGVLMKFATSFDMSKAAEMSSEKSASTPSSTPATGSGMNDDCVGRSYRSEARLIGAEQATAYAQASEDPRSEFQNGTTVPLMFAVNPFMDVAGQAVLDPDLNADLLRLVHGEQDMRFHRCLKPGDLVAPRATIQGIERKSSGELLHLHQRLMFNGEVACEATSSYFVRAPKKADAPKTDKTPKPLEEPPGDPLFTRTITVGAEQPIQYGHASGDTNPIHMDDATAKAAGHPGIILQGLCTMAFVGQAVIEDYLDGDFTRLQRLQVRFARPVLPGDVLTTRGWLKEDEEGRHVLSLLTTNQKEEPVITRALAEVAV